MNSVSRVAVVTDLDWISWWARFAGSFIRAEVRHFPLDRLDDARLRLDAPESGPSI